MKHCFFPVRHALNRCDFFQSLHLGLGGVWSRRLELKAVIVCFKKTVVFVAY